MRTGRQENTSPYPKRSPLILGNKVTWSKGNDAWVKSAEKSDELVVAMKWMRSSQSQGVHEWKTMKPEQLPLAFADSSQEGQRVEASDLSGAKAQRLRIVKGKEEPGFMAVPTESTQLMEQVASELNLYRALDKVVQNKGAPGVDGQSVEAVLEKDSQLMPILKKALLEGTYRPGDVRRVWIPKPGGGQRGLGIPNVIDRWVQQAVLQVLEPIYELTFHPSSHGFRKNHGALTAIVQAREELKAGRTTVVDMDLEKFFDRVNHQRLLSRLSQRIKDKRILQLIARMLKAGVIMPEGIRVETAEGTPQGGPLSPLLSNIVLDELDWELERRGLRFVRYADDCNIFVGSPRAGERVIKSIGQFIQKRLKLTINMEKSAVRKPSQVHFLGFRFVRHPKKEWAIYLSYKAAERIKKRLKELTPRNWGSSVESCLEALNTYIKGWGAYFRLCDEEATRSWKTIDGHVRRRVRAILLRQKKRPRHLFRELIRLGASKGPAVRAAWKSRSVWRQSARFGVHEAYGLKWFTEKLHTLQGEWRKHNSPTIQTALQRQLTLFEL